MSRLKSAFVIAVAVCAALIPLCAAAEHGSIAISADEVVTAPGSSFTFNVTGHSDPVIGAFSMDITFDPVVIQAQSCQSTFALCNKGAGEGMLTLNGANLLGYTGDLKFATLVFKAIGGAGSGTAVDIEVTRLADTETIDLMAQLTVTAGSVTVQSGGPQNPAGDADCDGEVTAGDGLAILSHLAAAGSAACLALGDVNCNDRVDIADALAILRQEGGLTSLPADC
jgi:hypothetical protein